MRSLQFSVLAVLIFGLLLTSSRVAFSQDEAIAEAVAEATPAAQVTPKSKVRPLTVAAGLVDDTVITGTLIDSTSISIQTAFGEASIPLSEVAGIRFPAGEDVSTTVVMLNGDSITGATDLKFANVETTWGSARINGQNITTMLFVPGLRWESSRGLGGNRWSLIESSPQNNPVRQASGTGPAQPSQTQPATSQPSGQRIPSRVIQGRTFPLQ